jgi:hypothetical protein
MMSWWPAVMNTGPDASGDQLDAQTGIRPAPAAPNLGPKYRKPTKAGQVILAVASETISGTQGRFGP